MNTMLRRCFGAGLVIAACALAQGCKPPNYPTGAIQQEFYAGGTWAVSSQTGTMCCDSLGNKIDLYYPTNLGAGGFKHPIITLRSRSFAKASDVHYLLNHIP